MSIPLAARLVFTSSNYDSNLSASPPTALPEGSGENPVQTCCSDIQMFEWDCDILPHRLVPPVLRPRGHHNHRSFVVHFFVFILCVDVYILCGKIGLLSLAFEIG